MTGNTLLCLSELGGSDLIDDVAVRGIIAQEIGEGLDDLVRDLMKGFGEEPNINSRIGARLEERFNNSMLHGYRVRVITEIVPSLGRNSLEKPMGADLYFAISVESKLGYTKTKGLLVQGKRESDRDRRRLEKQCRRMNLVTKKGSVVWIYSERGIGVVRSEEIEKQMNWHIFGVDKLFNRIFACTLGDSRKVPKGQFGDREALKTMIKALGVKNAAWLGLERI